MTSTITYFVAFWLSGRSRAVFVISGVVMLQGTKGSSAWPDTPKQAGNMLGGNLTPADRHGSVQVKLSLVQWINNHYYL